jgi:hypothetical protein
MATKSISELTSAVTVDNGTLLEVATPDAGSASGYTSEKVSVAQLADHTANTVIYPTLNTTSKTIAGAINELNASTGGVVLTGTLAAGNTSITLSNAAILTTSTFDFYTDKFGVNPTNVVAAAGSITLTFEAQASDLGVKVRVS